MTIDRMAELVCYTDRDRWPKFEMVIYMVYVSLEECNALVKFLDRAGLSDRKQHVLRGMGVYFKDAVAAQVNDPS